MQDTIAAFATPSAGGAVAILRLSGKLAYQIVSKLTNKDF